MYHGILIDAFDEFVSNTAKLAFNVSFSCTTTFFTIACIIAALCTDFGGRPSYRIQISPRLTLQFCALIFKNTSRFLWIQFSHFYGNFLFLIGVLRSLR